MKFANVLSLCSVLYVQDSVMSMVQKQKEQEKEEEARNCGLDQKKLTNT